MPRLRTASRSGRRAPVRLGWDALESRIAPATLAPTSLEQLFMERLNDVRSAQSSTLPDQMSVQPLAFDAAVKSVVMQTNPSQSEAQIESLLRQNLVNFVPSIGIEAQPLPSRSITTATSPLTDPQAAETVVSNILQSELSGQGTSTLIGRFEPGDEQLEQQRVVGFALDVNPSGGGGFLTTFGSITLAPADTSALVTGSVFADANGNGQYDLGEGLGGVSVAGPGGSSTQTYESGGFTLPVSIVQDTTASITASGGPLETPLVQSVPLEPGQNARLNFVASDQDGPVTPSGAEALDDADFDGDGASDFAVYQFNSTLDSGQFIIQRSSDQTKEVVNFGGAGDQPVVGDFDGDGLTDVAVFGFSPADGFSRFAILPSSGQPAILQPFGGADDQPVASDFDGDGRTDIAVFGFSPVEGFSRFAVLPSSGQPAFSQPFGGADDQPVAGDFDGDGRTDIAVFGFSPVEGFSRFAILFSTGRPSRSLAFGGANDEPVAGDFDGDGRTDPSVFGFSPANNLTRLAVLPSSGAPAFILPFEPPDVDNNMG